MKGVVGFAFGLGQGDDPQPTTGIHHPIYMDPTLYIAAAVTRHGSATTVSPVSATLLAFSRRLHHQGRRVESP
jgi:hypothetical protein